MMKRFCKRTALALTLGAGAGLAAAGSADAATFGAVADTYTRDGVSAGSATDLDVRGFANDGSSDLPDFVAYVRFDISSLIGLDITDATLTLHETAGSRNDGITNGRHQLFGLTNAAGNTAQDWDESIDLDPGAEFDNTGGTGLDLAQVFNLDPELGANVTETVPGTDNVAVTTTGADLVSFLQQRADDNGLVTFMVAIDAENRGYGFASRENEDVTLRPSLEVTAVPEPASLALIGLGGLAMLKRRR